MPNDVKKVFLYDVGKLPYDGEVGYLQHVKINGMNIRCENPSQEVDFKFISSPVQTNKTINVHVTNLNAPTAKVQTMISSNKKNKVNLSRSSFSHIDKQNGVILKMKECKMFNNKIK